MILNKYLNDLFSIFHDDLSKLEKSKNPTLILTSGKTGSGKTTLSKHLRNVFDCVYLQNDKLRVFLFPNPKLDKNEDELFFEIINSFVKELLTKKYSVIWDGRFPKKSNRLEKYTYSKKLNINFVVIYLFVEESIRKDRKTKRQIFRQNNIDSTYYYNSNLEKLRESNYGSYEEPDDSEGKYLIKFDNSNEPFSTLKLNILISEIEKLTKINAFEANIIN